MLKKQAKLLKSAACKHRDQKEPKKHTQNSGTRHRSGTHCQQGSLTTGTRTVSHRSSHHRIYSGSLLLSIVSLEPFFSHPLSQHCGNKPSHKHLLPCPELPSISTSDCSPFSPPHQYWGPRCSSLFDHKTEPTTQVPLANTQILHNDNIYQATGNQNLQKRGKSQNIIYSYRCH